MVLSNLARKQSDQHTVYVQTLFVEHSLRLRRFLHASMSDFSTVDDIVQETFLTVSLKASEYQSGTNFWAWTCAIARFKVLELSRSRVVAPRLLADEVLEALCVVQPATQHDDDAKLELLSKCLSKLTPTTQRILELRYSRSQRTAEIAQQIGWTPESVYVALARARSLLRQCVEQRIKTDVS